MEHDMLQLMPRTAKSPALDANAERAGVNAFLKSNTASLGSMAPLFPSVFSRRERSGNRREGTGRSTHKREFVVRAGASKRASGMPKSSNATIAEDKENLGNGELNFMSSSRNRRDVCFSGRRRGTGRETAKRAFAVAPPKRVVAPAVPEEEGSPEAPPNPSITGTMDGEAREAGDGIALTTALDDQLDMGGMGGGDSDMELDSSLGGGSVVHTVDASTDCEGLGDVGEDEVQSYEEVARMPDDDDDDGGGYADVPLESPSPQRPKRPRGPRYQKLKAQFESRKSLAAAGLQKQGEEGPRRSTRSRMKPLEYWRGEAKEYGRPHKSLATVVGVTAAREDLITFNKVGTQAEKKKKQGKRKRKGAPVEEKAHAAQKDAELTETEDES